MGSTTKVWSTAPIPTVYRTGAPMSGSSHTRPTLAHAARVIRSRMRAGLIGPRLANSAVEELLGQLEVDLAHELDDLGRMQLLALRAGLTDLTTHCEKLPGASEKLAVRVRHS